MTRAHWVPADDLVGLICRVDGELRPDLSLGQAARSCAEALHEPTRIVPLGTPRPARQRNDGGHRMPDRIRAARAVTQEANQ